MRKFVQNQGRTSKPQIWEIELNENIVLVRWGQSDGVMQQTTQSFEELNIGRSNYKSPNQVAEEWMDRQILLHTRKGYQEVFKLDALPFVQPGSTVIDFDNLPENLRFFKPQNTLNSHCSKLLNNNSANVLRKRDGMMHVISVGEAGQITMYSSTMQKFHKNEPGIAWLDRYPNIYQDLVGLNLPPKTILLGELCCSEKDAYGFGVDDFEYVGQVVKSLFGLAVDKQKHRPLEFCVWDVAFLNVECLLQTQSILKRLDLFKERLFLSNSKAITMPELLTASEDTIVISSPAVNVSIPRTTPETTEIAIKKIIRSFKWEGVVVIDSNPYDDRAYSFHGKPERPNGICKLKPKYEADFIARWDPDNGIGSRGKGKKSSGVGSVMLYLWDPDNNVEVPVCEVGGGLTDKDVVEFADPNLYPLVWQVEFDSWTAKGALRFPVFVRSRHDKNIYECTISQKTV